MIRGRGPSRAAPTTTCQKCLKKGHYSYECTATAQERPYTTRPSRTQQLSNPKLVPKLTSDVPNDLLRKKGVADEHLAKLASERESAYDQNLSPSTHQLLGKRSRSPSSSVSSVSTISTNRSRSVSPVRTKRYADEDYDKAIFSQQQSQRPTLMRKRQRSLSSASSSGSSEADRPYSRRRDRSKEDRNTRRRHTSISPDSRGRTNRNGGDSSRRRDRSREDSMDRSQIARQRLSMTPDRHGTQLDYESRDYNARGSGHRRSRRDDRRKESPDGYDQRADDDRHGTANRNSHASREGAFESTKPRYVPPAPPRERSLSPYSKRVALTRAGV